MFTGNELILVTGATSGIGEGCALSLNSAGVTVVAVARNQEKLSALRARAIFPEKILIEPRDLTVDVAALPEFVKELRVKYGKFNGLVYSAGMAELAPLRMWEYDRARLFFDVNYFAPIALLKGLLDRRNNVGENVSCVLLASAAATLTDKGHCTYAGSKAALIASMRSIAKEVVCSGVRVNSVSPSNVLTPMLGDPSGEYVLSQSAKYPLGLGEVVDVVKLVEFLLSTDSKWISGQNYVIDCASF